jgi:hypothetical protein
MTLNAVAKVIAAGYSKPCTLRATIMFTPAVAPGDEAKLEKWPSNMLAYLRAQDWQLPLYIKSAVPEDTQAKTVRVLAQARAARATWVKAGTQAPPWLDELWQESFKVIVGKWTGLAKVSGQADPNEKLKLTTIGAAQVWRTLRQAIADSTQGTAVKSEGAPERHTDSKPAVQRAHLTRVQNDEKRSSDRIVVQKVEPVRQADLSVLLETQRAFELSTTLRAAHVTAPDDTTWSQLEKECADIAKQGGVPGFPGGAGQVQKQARRQDTTSRNRKAAFEISRAYELHCPGYVCPVQLPATPQPAPTDTTSIRPGDLLKPNVPLHDSRKNVQHRLSGVLGSMRGVKDNLGSLNENTDIKTSEKELTDIIGQRFFTVQASPALSRLFALTIDVEFEYEALTTAAAALQWTLRNDRDFVWISTDNPGIPSSTGGVGGNANVTVAEWQRQVWTLAKVAPSRVFWPATCKESESASKNESASRAQLSQIEGVVVAGAPRETPGANEAQKDPNAATFDRFVITSLNVSTATEGAIDMGYKPLAQDVPGTPGSDCLRKTHQTAGLALLDRGRKDLAEGQLDRRDLHLSCKASDTGNLMLDADDLVIGYRLDVAVPPLEDKDAKTAKSPGVTKVGLQWRTLMARYIKHGDSGASREEVGNALSILLGPTAKPDDPHDANASSLNDPAKACTKSAAPDPNEWRQTIEDAVLGLAIRIVPETDASQQAGAKPVVAIVEESVAVWSGDPMGAHCAGPGQNKRVASQVATGDVIGLPDASREQHRRAPPLRFGRAYRFGLRTVYAGGLSVPLSYAAQVYDREPGITVPIHAIGEDRAFRRFLRHERIDPPYLLLPESNALTRNGAMGYEHAAHAIVRTANKYGTPQRGLPVSTQRVFAAPAVDLHFVNLHGVFDDYRVSHPPQGLPGINYNRALGGFPVAASQRVTGINGEVFAAPPTLSMNAKDQGDLVYTSRYNRPNERVKPYYPDPLAKYYVIGIRIAGTWRYLEGRASVFPVYPGTRYPDARPFTLDIRRADASPRREIVPRLEDVLKIPSGYLNEQAVQPAATLNLYPGDDFEVDVWCVPEWQDLANYLALVEALGVISLQTASEPGVLGTCKALAALLPESASEHIDSCIARVLNDHTPWRDGFAGMPVPPKPVLRAIAETINDTLRKRPLSEIAAVRTLRCTHAIDEAGRAPLFFTGADNMQMYRAFSADRMNIAVPPPKTDDRAPPAGGASASANLEYRLSGDVLLDLLSTSGLEIRATATLPTSSAFDDPQRGRSARDKRDDVWPIIDCKRLSMSSVFGFDVDAQGNVTLPKRTITLMRIDDLPVLAGTRAEYGDAVLTAVSLENYTPAPPDGQGIVKTRHVFPDKKARELQLTFIATPRHASLMRTANSEYRSQDYLRTGVDLSPRRLASNTVPLTLYLDAGVRPSAPSCRSPIPAFSWEVGRPKASLGGTHQELTRRSIIRVSMNRGWFSSGDGERLGIVVWPPVRSQMDEARLEKDRVSTRGGKPARVMDLSTFEDGDLGAGGKFITRWGDDPVRPPHRASDTTTAHTFIPRAAFRDLDPTAGRGFDASFVECVRMPVRKDSSIDKPSDASAAPEMFLEVALATYMPRFDVRTEQWYVDIDIEHPSEAEPFVRLGLVRFQEHAARDIQVSYPVVQWTQLLPRRHVQVDVVSKPELKEVTVSIVGQGAAWSILPDEAARGPRESEIWHRMHVKVVRQYSNEHAVKCFETKCEGLATRDLYPDGREAGACVTWTFGPHAIDVDPGADKEESATYHVHVEEHDLHLPATYSVEPVTPAHARGENVERITSGPRFSAQVNIPV